MKHILILGGTAEAAALAEALSAFADFHVTTSLAGRTRKPARLPGEMRSGGFGGPEGLASYLQDQSIDVLVDATHPFADQMTRHAVLAADQAKVPRLRLIRQPWERQADDRWVDAVDAEDAARVLPGLGQRIFLSTGQKDLAAFADQDDLWFLIRTIEPVAAGGPLPRQAHFIEARGPFDETSEIELLKKHRIDALITKASGGDATYAKIAAARRLGLPVVMINRAPSPPGPTVHDTRAALAWLRQVTG